MDQKKSLLNHLKTYRLESLVTAFAVGVVLSFPAVSRGMIAAAPKGPFARSVVFGVLAVVVFLLFDVVSKSVLGEKAAAGVRVAGQELSDAAKRAMARNGEVSAQ